MWRLLFILLTLTCAGQEPAAAPNAEAAFGRAIELQRRGDWAAAADAYRVLLARRPDWAEAHANLGATLGRLGRYNEAVASYERAYQLKPSLTPILLNLGIAHYRAGQFARAATTLEQFLQFVPDHTQARQLLGLSLVELGRDQQATGYLEGVNALGSGDVGLLYGLGLAYLRLRHEGFDGVLAALAALPQGAATARLLTGLALLDTADYARAAAELEAATKLDDALPRLYFSLGLAYLKTGRRADAVRELEREAGSHPNDFWTLYYLAYLYEAEEQWERAHARLTGALAVEPQSPEANTLLGKILLKQGQAAAAIKPLETAIARAPDDANRRFLLARAYQQAGKRAEATREFAAAQKLKDKEIEAERAGAPKPKE